MRSRIITAVVVASLALAGAGGTALAHEVDVQGTDVTCRGALISTDARGHNGLRNAAHDHADNIDGDTPRDFIVSVMQTCVPPGDL